MKAQFTDELDLAAVAIAVSCSRMFARLTLTSWGASKVIDDALLAVSERHWAAGVVERAVTATYQLSRCSRPVPAGR